MINKQQEKGVSPVIGVILMVAITVIIAAVVANFVLDLGGSLEQDAEATVTFDQDANYGAETYELTVTTSSFDNADYTYVQIAGGGTGNESMTQQSSVDDLSNDVPEDERDEAMVSSGDRIIVEDIDSEIDVQVFGVLEGSSSQVAGYSVSDDQRFFD